MTGRPPDESRRSAWTFLSNHALVFLEICNDPDVRVRDIAKRVEITERAVQAITHDLVQEGYIVVIKRGRRNHYQPILDANLRHPLQSQVSIRKLLAGLSSR